MVSELVTRRAGPRDGAIMPVRIAAVAPMTGSCSRWADEGAGDVAIAPVPGASGGWGLRVVDELAERWGSHAG